MCPKAEQLLGQIAKEYGTDRVVPLAFHVDYFNEPWKDPLSDKRFSEREMAYNYAQKDKGVNLYFTPMMMVDGQIPMLGSDEPKARSAIKRVLAEKPGVSLELSLEESPGSALRKSLKVDLAARAPGVVGRRLVIGVATWEDPVTTKVESGENAGKTLVEHFAVRRFAFEIVTPSRTGTRSLTFPVELEAAWDASHSGIAAFAQDEKTGRIYQASSLRWMPRPAEEKAPAP